MKKALIVFLVAVLLMLAGCAQTPKIEIFDENSYVAGAIWDPAAVSAIDAGEITVTTKLMIFRITDEGNKDIRVFDIPYEVAEAFELPAGYSGYILSSVCLNTDVSAIADEITISLNEQDLQRSDSVPDEYGLTYDEGWSISPFANDTIVFARPIEMRLDDPENSSESSEESSSASSAAEPSEESSSASSAAEPSEENTSSGSAPESSEESYSSGSSEPQHVHDNGELKVMLAPTCTVDGWRAYFCTACGEQIGEREVIPATGHIPGDWVLIQSPTCIEEGIEVQPCKICGETIKTEKLDIIDHDYEFVEHHVATCTQGGTDVYVCRVCGQSATIDTEAFGHEYVLDQRSGNKVCTRCGEVLYHITCKNSTFTVGNSSRAMTDGYYPEGTVITVSSSSASFFTVYWESDSFVSGDRGHAAPRSFRYTVDSAVDFICFEIVN